MRKEKYVMKQNLPNLGLCRLIVFIIGFKLRTKMRQRNKQITKMSNFFEQKCNFPIKKIEERKKTEKIDISKEKSRWFKP